MFLLAVSQGRLSARPSSTARPQPNNLLLKSQEEHLRLQGGSGSYLRIFYVMTSGPGRIIFLLTHPKINWFGTFITSAKSLHLCHSPLARSKSQVLFTKRGIIQGAKIIGAILGFAATLILSKLYSWGNWSKEGIFFFSLGIVLKKVILPISGGGMRFQIHALYFRACSLNHDTAVTAPGTFPFPHVTESLQ